MSNRKDLWGRPALTAWRVKEETCWMNSFLWIRMRYKIVSRLLKIEPNERAMKEKDIKNFNILKTDFKST